MEFILGLLGSDAVLGWFQTFLNAEITKMTMAFTIAAHLHRRWVKKDMKDSFEMLTKSIDNVANKMSEGFTLHSARIDNLTERVRDLEEKHK